METKPKSALSVPNAFPAMDHKAQISAELLIIMAAVLAVTLILVSNLRSTANKAETKLEARESSVLNKT